ALATVENEAFRITNNPVDDTTCGSGSSPVAKVIQPNITQCADGYHWDNTLRQCVANNCPQDYHWNGTQCVPDGPPAPRPTRLPSGTINVQDITLNTVRVVRNATLIA